MGRAARHILREVVMYADMVTGSMERAIKEVERRRNIQFEYNEEYKITPTQITKPIRDKLVDEEIEEQISKKEKGWDTEIDYMQLPPRELKKELKVLEKIMKYEAEMLNFERAAEIRDKIVSIKKKIQH